MEQLVNMEENNAIENAPPMLSHIFSRSIHTYVERSAKSNN